LIDFETSGMPARRLIVSVDGGMFAGPFVSGLLTVRHAGVLPEVMLVVLAAVGLALLAHARLTARSR